MCFLPCSCSLCVFAAHNSYSYTFYNVNNEERHSENGRVSNRLWNRNRRKNLREVKWIDSKNRYMTVTEELNYTHSPFSNQEPECSFKSINQIIYCPYLKSSSGSLLELNKIQTPILYPSQSPCCCSNHPGCLLGCFCLHVIETYTLNISNNMGSQGGSVH